MWWQALNLLQKIYFCIAVPASVTLVVLIVLMLIGVGSDATEIDLNGDGTPDVEVDASDGLSFFTFRGLVAFFTIGGWVGYTLADGSAALAIILSLVCGTAALVGMAYIMKALLKLQDSGNIEYKKAVGGFAEVYLTIPPKDKGEGKINLNFAERFIEVNARQDGEEPIATGSRVKIVGIVGNTYIVEKI